MFLVDLNQELGIIEVSGADSANYLQGQLTNDIRLVDNISFQYSAHLNNKGRMLASFIITKSGDNIYHLITHKDIITKILPRMKMFVLRAKVTLTALEQVNLVYTDHNCSSGIYSLELTEGNFLSLVTTTPNISPKDIKLWHYFLIKNGICMIYPGTHEKLIPQQVNYDSLGGINFKKGCYTGQEIVARMHYLGKANHLMYKFICDSEVKIGQPVVSPDMDNQEIGTIVDVASREFDYMGLVSLKNNYRETAFITVSDNTSHQLLTQPLIYKDING